MICRKLFKSNLIQCNKFSATVLNQFSNNSKNVCFARSKFHSSTKQYQRFVLGIETSFDETGIENNC